jgi:hypothetical protein
MGESFGLLLDGAHDLWMGMTDAEASPATRQINVRIPFEILDDGPAPFGYNERR